MATISHQLIRAVPRLANPVIEAVESDSALFSLSLPVQLRRLIVDPIIGLMEQDLWPKDSPQLVAIDGLDECLNIILGLAPPGNETPYSPLDKLYHYILSTVNNYPATSRVLGAMLYKDYDPYAFTKYWQRTPEILDCLLLSEKGNTALNLLDLHSVVYVPSQEFSSIHVALEKYNSNYDYGSNDDYDCDDDNNSLNPPSRNISTIRFFHASFMDFLIDASRSGQYYINKRTFHGDLALCCFQNVSHEINRYKQPSPTIVAQQYASESCFDYLLRAAIMPHLLDASSTMDFLDVLKCGFLATLDQAVYEAIETPASKVLKRLSLLTDNSQAGRIFTSLQDAMDLHHLDILSGRPSSNIKSFFPSLSNRVYAERTMEFPIHLKGGISEIYGEWLL
ncbi:hypothetical protein BDQ12DRAFT_728256 [Crucibulum laeve]|uniref:Uncharacterized protein n=1 Tax=Crucibulum laeve TaxID=68775 RepID=A0A5C3LIK2_9AGAR|nr:hypothetical protein BDQ12DRAFT_728256 [Crucibulum laeve]